MSQNEYLRKIAEGVVGFSGDMKIFTDEIRENLDKVLTRHYQANHTPYAVMSFEDEAHYWEETLAEAINRIEYPDYDALEPKGVTMLQRRSYVIVRGNLKSGNTIHFDNTKFNQLYINGERYTGDYTFNGETPETYERLVVVVVQTPFNLGVKDYGNLEMTVADFPIENAEIFVNIGKYSELQPNINELLQTDTAESLYVSGDFSWEFNDYCPIKTISITGKFIKLSTTWNCPCLKDFYMPNTNNVLFKTGGTSTRNLDISKATGTIQSNAFSNSHIRGLVDISNISNIDSNAFMGCKYITGVKISNNLTYIGESVFNGCIRITEITIPDSVTSVGRYLFQSCTSLKKVIIGDSLSQLQADFFNGCSALEEITIGKSIGSLSNARIFEGCTAIKTLRVSKGYHCPSTPMTSSRIIDWRCFLEVFENCAEIGEDGRTATEMLFRVTSNVLESYDNALIYEGDDETLLRDKEIATQIAEFWDTKRVKIST